MNFDPEMSLEENKILRRVEVLCELLEMEVASLPDLLGVQGGIYAKKYLAKRLSEVVEP